MAEWNNEMVLEFLQLFSAEPVLYNPAHPHLKNKNVINNSWSRIQQAFSVPMPVSELKKKKDSLLSSFRYQMKKKKEAMLLGKGPFQTTWFAFDIMYNLFGQTYENEIVNNADDSEPVIEFVGFDALDVSPQTYDTSSSPQELNTNLNISNIISKITVPENNAELNHSQVDKKKSKRKQEAFQGRRTESPATDQESSSSRTDDEDECDLYGKFIAKKLKKLPDFQRERLMYEIQGLFVRVPPRIPFYS